MASGSTQTNNNNQTSSYEQQAPSILLDRMMMDAHATSAPPLPERFQSSNFEALQLLELSELEDECTICLEPYGSGDNSPILLPCRREQESDKEWRHVLCIGCAKSWFAISRTCPTCRIEVIGQDESESRELPGSDDDFEPSSFEVRPPDDYFGSFIFEDVENTGLSGDEYGGDDDDGEEDDTDDEDENEEEDDTEGRLIGDVDMFVAELEDSLVFAVNFGLNASDCLRQLVQEGFLTELREESEVGGW